MTGAAVQPLGGDSAGVRVASVAPGWTAERLGLRAGDVVLGGVDHNMMRYPDREHAFRGEGGVPATGVLDVVLRWLARRGSS